MRNSVAFFLSLFAILATWQASAQSQPVFVSLSGLSIARYDSAFHPPAERAHVKRVFIDYQKFGFFRLGCCPLLVLDSVEIQTRSPQSLAALLAQTQAHCLLSQAPSHVQIRNLQLHTASAAHLQANAAQFTAGGDLALQEVRVQKAGSQDFRLPKATLRLVGPCAGCLYWEPSGCQTNTLMF